LRPFREQGPGGVARKPHAWERGVTGDGGGEGAALDRRRWVLRGVGEFSGSPRLRAWEKPQGGVCGGEVSVGYVSVAQSGLCWWFRRTAQVWTRGTAGTRGVGMRLGAGSKGYASMHDRGRPAEKGG